MDALLHMRQQRKAALLIASNLYMYLKGTFHSVTLKNVRPIFPWGKEVRQYAKSNGKSEEHKNFLPDIEAVLAILQFTFFTLLV